MKKNYKGRIIVLFIIIASFIYSYIAAYLDVKIVVYNSFVDPIAFTALFYGVASILTFFISDNIFKKWLIFTLSWFAFSFVLIMIAPVNGNGALGLGPTKESVSIWMGGLFVIVSIIMFVWSTIQEKKHV